MPKEFDRLEFPHLDNGFKSFLDLFGQGKNYSEYQTCVSKIMYINAFGFEDCFMPDGRIDYNKAIPKLPEIDVDTLVKIKLGQGVEVGRKKAPKQVGHLLTITLAAMTGEFVEHKNFYEIIANMTKGLHTGEDLGQMLSEYSIENVSSVSEPKRWNKPKKRFYQPEGPKVSGVTDVALKAILSLAPCELDNNQILAVFNFMKAYPVSTQREIKDFIRNYVSNK